MSRAPKGEEKKARLEEIAIPVLATSSTTNDFGLEVCINRVRTSCLVDTGTAVSLISEKFWERIKGEGEQLSPTGFRYKLVSIQGEPLQLCGSTRVRLEIDGLQKVFFVDVQVVKSLTNDIILGRDFLKGNWCEVRLDHQCNRLHFTTEKTTVNLGHQSLRSTISSVSISVGDSIDSEVPPQREMEVAKDTTSSRLKEPSSSDRNTLCVARTMTNPETGSQIALMKPLLEKDVHLASICSAEQTPSAGVVEEKQKQFVLDAGDTLSAEERLDDFRCTEKVRHGTKIGNATPARQHVRWIPSLKPSLTEVCSDVWYQLQASHKRQKETYDKKVHGKPYQERDFVWLYTPAIPQGQARRLLGCLWIFKL